MSLYNMIHGFNQYAIIVFLTMLDINLYEIGRFRDVFLGEDENSIEVFTRLGAGNRKYHQEEIEFLRNNKHFRKDYDEVEYDATYATFVYNIPEKWRKDFDLIINSEEIRIIDFSQELQDEIEKWQKRLKEFKEEQKEEEE